MTGALTITASGPPPAEVAAVQRLLHPLTPEEFLADHWHVAPVHLTGWRDRFPGLFDREALARVVARQRELGISVRVSGDREGDGGGAGAQVRQKFFAVNFFIH